MFLRVVIRLVMVFVVYLLLVVLEGHLPIPTLPIYFASFFGLCVFFAFPFGGYFPVLRRAPILTGAGKIPRILALTGICLLLTLFSFVCAGIFVFRLPYEMH